MKTIQCPLYGNILIDNIALLFIDTTEFQRLHNIKQTGMCFKVFPSATHSRYIHSIGVYHLCARVLYHLKHGLSERDCLLLKLAALLHDIGHGPFGHIFERSIQKHISYEWSHETQTIRMIQYMIQKYNIPLTHEETCQICDYIKPPDTCIRDWKYQIVANKYNSIDVDKLDYLQRDMFVMGIYSKIPVDRIISGMRIQNNKLCFTPNTVPDIADLLFQRFRMYRQIYQHRVVVAFDVLLERIIDGIKNIESYINNIELFIQLNDQTLIFITSDTDAKLLMNNRKFDRYLGKYHKIEANIVGQQRYTSVIDVLKCIHFTNGKTLNQYKQPQVQMLSLLTDKDWI